MASSPRWLRYSTTQNRASVGGPQPRDDLQRELQAGRIHMSGITVLSPLGINRVGSQPLAPRLSSLDGVKLGLLNNSKPNSLELQRRVVELLAKQHAVAGAVTKQKPSAAIGAEGLDAYAKEVGAVMMLVSGPIVQEIGLNFRHGAFGPGFRANASIGRAMRLVLVNVGGGIPGEGDQATHGSPAKFSYCVAENEAATPWEPFRVTRGFARTDSTVTVFSGEGPHNINDHVCTSAETTLTVVADTMTTIGHNNAGSVIRGDVLVAFGPEHAHTVASGDMSKGDVQRFLFERARNKVGLLKLRAMYKAENWPDWVAQNDDEALCPIVGKPEDIHIVVTGGPGKHSAFIPTFGTSKSVTRKIEAKS
jgi:hypothetical protein